MGYTSDTMGDLEADLAKTRRMLDVPLPPIFGPTADEQMG